MDAEPPNDRSGANSLTWWTGDVAGHVDRVGEAGGELDGRVHGERRPMRRRRPDRCSSAGLWIAPPQTKTWRASIVTGLTVRAGGEGPCGPAVVEHEAVDTVIGDQAGAGGDGSGQVRLGHALAPAVVRLGAGLVGHPARDLVVAPAEAGGPAAQGVAGRADVAGHALHGQHLLDLVADLVELVGLEVGDVVVACASGRGPPPAAGGTGRC